MYGRIKHGLNPWRDGLKHLRQSGKLVFNSNIVKHWSEEWKSAEDWLLEIKYGLKVHRSNVKIGGVFDRWDIQNRVGLLASVRSTLTIEEHGMGKQYLILRRQIIISKLGVSLWFFFLLITVFAFLDQAIVVSAVLGIWTILFGLKIIHDSAGAVTTLDIVMQGLPNGVSEQNGENLKSRQEGETETHLPPFSVSNVNSDLLISNGSPSILNVSRNKEINQSPIISILDKKQDKSKPE